MHKKLLALVATVSVLLSLFAGNAFATRQANGSLDLNTTDVISSAPHTEYQPITGTISSVGARDVNYVIRVEGQQVGTIYDQLDANGNSFQFYLPTNMAPQDVIVSALANGNVVATATIQVRYNVTITNLERLQFTYSEERNPVAIIGKVTNSRGEPVAAIPVSLRGVDYIGNASGNSYFTDIKTDSEGEFGAAVPFWVAAERLELCLGADDEAVAHLQGEITPKAASLEVTPQRAVRTIAQTELMVSGSGFAPCDQEVILNLHRDGKPLDGSAAPTLPQNVRIDSTGQFATSFTWTPQQAGTYTLLASSGNYSASATIEVTNPSSYNLINSSELEVLNVGVNEFTIGSSGIHLVHYLTSASFSKDFVYTIYLDGVLAQEGVSGNDFDKLESGTFAVPANGLGTKTISIVVHKLADKHKPDARPVFERTITAKVNGWDVTIYPAQITVNQAQDITLIVSDENGGEVNNAGIEIEGYSTYPPGTFNVRQGIYNFKEVMATAVGPKAVKVYRGDQLMAELELDVVGQQVYKVATNVATLLQGHGEDVQLIVTRDDEAITPWFVKWFYADGSFDTAYPTHNSEGRSKVNINARKAGPLTLRVENIDGTLCGETILQVIAPRLDLANPTTPFLTNNLRSQVRFRIIDPRDNTVLTSDLEVNPHYLSAIEVWDARGTLIDNIARGASVHVITVLPQATVSDWETAALAEENTALVFKINGALVEGMLPVREASITSNPDHILIGVENNLTFTYRDANGLPIVGKAVLADDKLLGNTDANGQVTYSIGVATSVPVIKAATDVPAVKMELPIRPVYDTEKPQVVHKVMGNKATFVITDNVRITRIEVDGQNIAFQPSSTYEFQRTLQAGVNTVHIKAQDANNNVLDESIRITHTPASTTVVLRGNQIRLQDGAIFVQVRELQELGVQFAWQPSSQVVTLTLGRNRVEMVIGSMIGRVNGAAVAMPAAPFQADGHIYFPLHFVSEIFGWKVHSSASGVVTITS